MQPLELLAHLNKVHAMYEALDEFLARAALPVDEAFHYLVPVQQLGDALQAVVHARAGFARLGHGSSVGGESQAQCAPAIKAAF
jgi:hypothetical protein